MNDEPDKRTLHHFDGQTYHFATPDILRAARKTWGANSQRVKKLHELLEAMIEAADDERGRV